MAVLLLLGSFELLASEFRWDLEITGPQYTLSIGMRFSATVPFSKVQKSLKDYRLLSQVSGPIIRGEALPTSDRRYEQTLTLENFKIKSHLYSDCSESEENGEWVRYCVLNTGKGAGKMSMVKKYDKVSCQSVSPVHCRFEIVGTARDLKVLGFLTLMPASKLVLKGKFEALKNFAKIWSHIEKEQVSIQYSLLKYESSPLKQKIDLIWSQGQKALTQSPFKLQSQDSFSW